MRKPDIMLLFLLFIGSYLATAKNPMFYIATSCNNQAATGYMGLFESEFTNALKKEFPCVETLSDNNVVTLLQHEKQKQLLGSGDYDEISNIGEAMGSDYLVSLKVQILGNTALITAFCIDNRTSKVISRSTSSGVDGNAGIQAVEKVSKQLVEGLKKYEICPFKGPINVVVKTERTDKKNESYAVYCNGMDGLYKLDVTVNKTSDADWKLKKTSKNQVSGSVTYNLREETETEEQNDCYICPSGRQGARMYTEKTTKTSRVEGLSNESVADNQQIEDARAEITFLDNGTYSLKVKAASKKGDLILKIEKRAEGTCDNQSPLPENITKKADVPLNEVTFGPFSGTSLDKVLSHKDSYSSIDPVTKEKTTVTYDYDLKKD
ncbi:MAG: hypothetical protein Q8S54_11595 [Bacteroidota bacterium]|nr:hypothetical protein [Odoribacter sp.]MDP3643820.1 hypothetical protein [Bacteroidota bacterium]